MEYVMAAYMGAQLVSSVFSGVQQAKQTKIASRAAQQQAEEIARQRRLEERRQRRENEELMNSVSNLKNVAWSGASAPSMSFDKYGDLG